MPMRDLADLFAQVDSAQDGGTSDVKTQRRRSPTGQATTRLVLSAHVGNNADVFPQILKLHVPIGSRIADVTYGKGSFWRQVRATDYTLHMSDIADGTDCRELPYDDNALDCVVLDPPIWKDSTGGMTQRKRAVAPTRLLETITQMGARNLFLTAQNGMAPCLICTGRPAPKLIVYCETGAS